MKKIFTENKNILHSTHTIQINTSKIIIMKKYEENTEIKLIEHSTHTIYISNSKNLTNKEIQA